ncbi:MAG TPA: sugar ABC transporter ATP-binding protein [Bryobacteraceae bacterium]|nr:sugar ABC transporter ATP-binding protein [Bryobacteraceae bacterium]
MAAPLLEARKIHKSFAGVRALQGVNFDLRAGEVHALVGENGAGKSTLIKTITGALTADSGIVRVAGREIAHNNPGFARSLGIAAIYQQPSLFPHLTVAENIAWTLERGNMWRPVAWRERHRRAAELIDRAGGSIDPARLAGSLSMPEQQIVEIAKAIGAGARILIMDEPTASLSDTEVESLFQVIASLRAQGSGVVYISHRLNEIFAIADRITVLRDGESIGTKNAKEIDSAGLIEMMAGRPLASVFPKRELPIGEVALELRNVSSRGGGVRDISLSVRAGEILGLAGLVGSGRTELAETIFGLRAAGSGEILVQKKPVRIASPVDAIAAGIGYVPEDRRRHGVVLDMPIAANTSLASLPAISRRGWIDRTAERALADRYVTQLRIKTPSVYADCSTLSGGNQQKVALARWLAIAPKILILDEPTQGIDVGAKAEIHRLMGDLAERGIAIMMISSELPEILGMSDRIAVMNSGSVSGILARAEATQQKILTLALGHKPTGPSARIRE